MIVDTRALRGLGPPQKCRRCDNCIVLALSTVGIWPESDRVTSTMGAPGFTRIVGEHLGTEAKVIAFAELEGFGQGKVDIPGLGSADTALADVSRRSGRLAVLRGTRATAAGFKKRKRSA